MIPAEALEEHHGATITYDDVLDFALTPGPGRPARRDDHPSRPGLTAPLPPPGSLHAVLWVLVWVVLVLAAAGVFFLLGRDLWRKATALTRELGVATDRLSEVSDRLADLTPLGAPSERPVPVMAAAGS